MQYFPAVDPLVRRHRLRLIALAKAECPPGNVRVINPDSRGEYSQCDQWRQRSLSRIEARTDPSHTTVILSGSDEYVPLGPDGEGLEGKAGARAMQQGYEATMQRLRNRGFRVIVIKDPPTAPDNIPSCVSQNLHDLVSCAFRPSGGPAEEFDAKAASRVRGAHLISLDEAICPRNVCRAVIGNAIVYRDTTHLSATFARTLEPWIERDLKRHGVPF